MKKLYYIFIILFTLNAFSVLGQSVDSENNNSVNIENSQEFTPINPACDPEAKALDDSNSQNTLMARQGCCSHHKGVCGCANGRVACCDGTLSPSCGC